MEQGTIVEVASFGTGTIQPNTGGGLVLFTRYSFKSSWNRAVPGAKVQFERFSQRSEAKAVFLNGQARSVRARKAPKS